MAKLPEVRPSRFVALLLETTDYALVFCSIYVVTTLMRKKNRNGDVDILYSIFRDPHDTHYSE